MTETFVACCEEGNFRPLKDKASMAGQQPELSEVLTRKPASGHALAQRSAASAKPEARR